MDDTAALRAGDTTRYLFDRLGERWTLAVLEALDQRGSLRYSELHIMIPGISQKMLTHTLRVLERDHLISRTIYPQIPPKVVYALTSTGVDLHGLIQQLADWAAMNVVPQAKSA